MQIAVEGIGIQNLAVSVKDKAASEKGRLKKKKRQTCRVADQRGRTTKRRRFRNPWGSPESLAE